MKKTGSKRYSGIRLIKKGTYEVYFIPYKKARRVFRYVKAESLQEAEQERARLLQEWLMNSRVRGTVKPDVDFATLRAQLERDAKGDGLRKKTITRALNTFDCFFTDFLRKKFPEVTSLSQLNVEVFNEYKNYVVNDLHRPKGWRSELGTLKGVIGRFTRAGFCDRKVKEALMEFKKPSVSQKEYKELTKEDRRKLLEFIKVDRPHYYPVTYFLARLGWRIEETLTIKRANVRMVNFKPVRIKLEGDARKNGQEFVLETIDHGLSEVICALMSDGKAVPWLFVNQLNHKITANRYRDYLARISKELLKKRVTPHDFRHSFVTEAGLKNMPLRDVMAITGHLDIDVLLKFYSHSTIEGREKVLEMSRI